MTPMYRNGVLPALLATLALSGCSHGGGLPAPIPRVTGDLKTAFQQQYIDISTGTGAPAEPRKCIFAHYTGWLLDGKKFDSSRDTTPQGRPREPISFPQGARRVISGWDIGFEGMRVGARRRLFIPYQLAYGENGRPPLIPPKSTLVFDVELMAVTDTLPRSAGAPSTGTQAAAPRCPSWSEAARPATP
jgi:peptidylprolyl isomerase